MKALTLWQPWASLIALGHKRYETRSWKPFTDELRPGQRFAIHASTRSPAIPDDDLLREYLGVVWPMGKLLQDLPRGCVVAVATLAEVRTTEVGRYLSEIEYAFGDYEDGRWAWRLDGVLALPEPVPCCGRQKLWDLPPDVEQQVREQMARAGVGA